MQRLNQTSDIARAVMVYVRRPQHLTRKLLKQEILFIGRVIGTNYRERAILGAQLSEFLRDGGESLSPRHRPEGAIGANERRGEAFRVFVEIESIASLYAQELAIY